MVNYSDISFDAPIKEELEKLDIDFAFQPIYDSKTMKVHAYEALMRPKGRSPLDLIEEYQEMDELHTIEVATCFGAMQRFRDRGYNESLTYNSLPSESMTLEEITLFHQMHGDMCGRVIVEMVEYTKLNELKWSVKLNELKRRGINIAVDDFGSGNNSYAAIDKFQADYVKIDRELLSGIDTDEEKQKNLVELVETLHKLQIKVIAEGIETKEELDFIRSTGVDYLQGYYLGRPA